MEMARATRAIFMTYIRSVRHAETSLLIGLGSKNQTYEEITGILNELAKATGYFINVAWLNQQGRIVASTLPESIGLDASDRQAVNEIMQGRNWSISDLFIGPFTKQARIRG